MAQVKKLDIVGGQAYNLIMNRVHPLFFSYCIKDKKKRSYIELKNMLYEAVNFNCIRTPLQLLCMKKCFIARDETKTKESEMRKCIGENLWEIMRDHIKLSQLIMMCYRLQNECVTIL